MIFSRQSCGMEIVFPLQKDRKIIGTQVWEFKPLLGAVKGLSFGTVSAKFMVEFTQEGEFDVEYALDWQKKLSPVFELYAGIEGTIDGIEIITQLQIYITPRISIKLNNAFGIPSNQGIFAIDAIITY